MALNIKRPSDFNILFIGDGHLEEQARPLVEAGTARFLRPDDEEARALLDGKEDLIEGPIALVMEEGVA